MKYNISQFKRIDTSRIALLGFLLSILAVTKYAFSFIPGVEFVTFLFIVFAIFLPVLDLSLLLISFILFTVIINGVGPWWLMYWIMWPLIAFATKGISKITTNKYVLSIWGFLAGSSTIFWFYISDLLFFGTTYANLNLITAIPVSLIEGLVTLVGCITLLPALSKVFLINSNSFLTIQGTQRKNKYIDISVVIGLVVLAITMVIVIYIFNDHFILWKQAMWDVGQKGGHI